MKKFPFNHILKCDTQEVWIKCDSSITAMGLSFLVDKYYPGFAGKIASEEYLNKLKTEI